jgi:hypothetical protein
LTVFGAFTSFCIEAAINRPQGANRMPRQSFTRTEQEVIVLKAVWELIDEMVNYEMFLRLTRIADVELRFNTMTHQRLFNVILVDFLSQPSSWPFELDSPPAGTAASQRSILFHFSRICDDPKLNPAGGAALRLPLDAFTGWLETECEVKKVWLPSINLETDIKLKRIAFIKICGNIGKHNFTRLSANVGAIREILKANGTEIEPDEGYLVIPEFYEWFHTNVFSYHSSAIAEFLNNIRWAIYDYLRPEFERSFTKDDPASLAYRFVYPTDCRLPVAQTMYWDLMNAVRTEPYMPRFEVTRFLKMRY